MSGASPESVNRVVCYCNDCQAFAHAVGRPDILDARGGTDIVQIAPATMSVSQGHDHIVALRLSETGPYRFHTKCCGTPLGNTRGPSIPLIGIPLAVFGTPGQDLDHLFGPPRANVFGEDAIGGALPGSKGVPLAIVIRTIWKIMGWRLAGLSWPHPFFDRASKEPVFPVDVVSSARR